VAVKEMKSPQEFNTDTKRLRAAEQGLYSGAVLGATIAIISDGISFQYVDVEASLKNQILVFIDETRDLNPGVLEEVLSGGQGVARDPGLLAEKTWQAIWHATKEEPRECLMTFVEIFILKFLSDNLPKKILPESHSFYELVNHDLDAFQKKHGTTQIEYYVSTIRPRIKTIFPDKTVVTDPELLSLFGLSTIVSNTSVINGFAFLQSSETSLPTFNRTFVDILGYFNDFGILSRIDPEFKLRLYETFLKKSVRQAKLGQFFTPRNVVRSMIDMAELDKLQPGSLVLDPACGVGGFLLEPLIEKNALANNITFDSGSAKQRVRIVGADVDINTNILAKANTLLHLAEFVRDPNVTVKGLQHLMADMFHVVNSNQHLGSLEYPITEKADVILTNPPYVTQGSGIYKEEIKNIDGNRNNLDLREYYDRTGLGLESLFLRYISGALKPGGRGFVIVPQGLLTRTEKTAKEKLLLECNLLASISLPRNTFFNTPQKTFILAIEKRHTASDPRPNVLCAIASSIGETLDARRVPTPADNTLSDIARAFLKYTHGNPVPEETSNRIRIVPSTSFAPSDRWDVQRFWSDDELVLLGAREEAVDRVAFIDASNEQLAQVIEDFQTVKVEIAALNSVDTVQVSLGNESYFRVRRGKRVVRRDGDQHPGTIPVYSGSKDPKRPLCSVSEEWATNNGLIIEEEPIITVNANGYVGACFVRRERCIIHDDVMIIEVLDNNIDLDYLAQALRSSIAAGNFEYEAKLYNRVKELEVNIPISGDAFDIENQKIKSDVVKRFDTLRTTLTELGAWADESRIRD
jgi:type I restriction-modification system DNA methylase subunit